MEGGGKNPKDCGDDERKRRNPGARSVNPRLNDVAANQFERHEKSEGEQRHHPAWRNREGQHNRECRPNPRANVGNEAKQSRERTPQDRIWQTDEGKTDGHGNAVGDIDHELHAQVARDAAARIVHRLSRGRGSDSRWTKNNVKPMRNRF
jgi:hypothetical protein